MYLIHKISKYECGVEQKERTTQWWHPLQEDDGLET